jgi:hypothetical protein
MSMAIRTSLSVSTTPIPGRPHSRFATQTTVANCLQIRDDGSGTLYGDYDRAGTVVFNNADAGANIVLAKLQRSGVDRVLFTQDTTNSLAKVKAATSGYAMQVEGDTVDLNTTNSTGVIAKFKTNGTTRFNVQYDGTEVVLESAVPIWIANSAAGAGTIAEMSKGGTSHLLFKWDSTNSAIVLETDAGITTDTDLYLRSAGNVKVTLDYDNDQTGTFSVLDYSGSSLLSISDSRVFSLFSASNTVLQAAQTAGTTNYDSKLLLGGVSDFRGRVQLGRDSSATKRAGVLTFEVEDGGLWFVWVKTDGKLMISDTKDEDPDTDDTNGTVVGTQS